MSVSTIIEIFQDILDVKKGTVSLSTTSSDISKQDVSYVTQEHTALSTDDIRHAPTGEESSYIPYMPKGRVLTFRLLSTWETPSSPRSHVQNEEDQKYIGLSGIELFDDQGRPVAIQDVKAQVKVFPPHPENDDFLTPENEKMMNPEKIFDGVHWTREDSHCWLAPFDADAAQDSFPSIDLDLWEDKCLSMIRIWNYNRSREHSGCGVRALQIFFDGRKIFNGEVKQALGRCDDPESCFELVLFTHEEKMIARIASNDWLNNALAEVTGEFSNQQQDPNVDPNVKQDYEPTLEEVAQTCARRAAISQDISVPVPTYRAQRVRFEIFSTWGNEFYVGLMGLQLLDGNLQPLPLKPTMLSAEPEDLNTTSTGQIHEEDGPDPRVLDNLLTHSRLSNFDESNDGWITPFVGDNMLEIDLGESLEVGGLYLWNYCAEDHEDTAIGVKEFRVFVDDEYLSNFICRKAPELPEYEFDCGQLLVLAHPPVEAPSPEISSVMIPSQQYQTAPRPCGFTIRIVVVSNWGDDNYVGLNGLVFYGPGGDVIKPPKIFSSFGNEQDHGAIAGDDKTVDKLLDGVNDTSEDDLHMWYAFSFDRLS